MAVQLLGSGGVAALLLLSSGTGLAAIADVAMLLSLLAAFSAAAFAANTGVAASHSADDGERE